MKYVNSRATAWRATRRRSERTRRVSGQIAGSLAPRSRPGEEPITAARLTKAYITRKSAQPRPCRVSIGRADLPASEIARKKARCAPSLGSMLQRRAPHVMRRAFKTPCWGVAQSGQLRMALSLRSSSSSRGVAITSLDSSALSSSSIRRSATVNSWPGCKLQGSRKK